MRAAWAFLHLDLLVDFGGEGLDVGNDPDHLVPGRGDFPNRPNDGIEIVAIEVPEAFVDEETVDLAAAGFRGDDIG